MAGLLTLSNFNVASAQTLGLDISHGSRKKNEVALTFHGAGDLKIARELLSISKDKGAPITVMAVGKWLAANPTMGQEILADGNELGNHTYNHLAMMHLDLKQATYEIAKGKDAIVSSVGSMQKYFRPSGTPKSNSTIRKAALAAGYRNCITYDVDSMDYTGIKAGPIIENCMANVKSGSIISLHFDHKYTVLALPRLIEELKSKGLTPVTVTQLLS